MSVLSTTDFIDVDQYYGIPNLRFDSQVNPLTSCINFSQVKFLQEYSLTEAELVDEIKEALKYYTFAEWLRAEWLKKTPSGASVQKKQLKGQPVYDITREVEARNMCIRILNDNLDLDTPYSELKPIINY